MTNKIFFILAALCSIQAQANVARSYKKDSVQHTSYYHATELMMPVQPVYLDGVVLPASRSGNWFVSITGGTTAFLGTPLGCADLFGRLKPSYNISAGKWFTPSIGSRISYSGLQIKDAGLSTQDYHHIHADLLWNVLGYRYSVQEKARWCVAPFVGVGLLHNATIGHNPFALSYGIQGQYRISKRVSAMLELSNTTTFQDFDGYGRSNRLGDHLLSLSAGFTFHIGKIGWKRAVDATPYIYRNERLSDYTNFLLEENRRYAGQHDRDRRTLAELKKILEIEGLLDTYGYIIDNNTTDSGKGYPVNNYSGLNSLRARLKNRHWDGISLLDSTAIQSGNGSPIFEQSDFQRMKSGQCDSLATDSMTFLYAAGECIGAPVYFFFNLNTANLTDASQMLNLDELARVANKYGLSARVTGAADSSTGTPDINKSLSSARAEFITAELMRRKIPANRITQTSKGGIADHTPTEANRHTKVELFFPSRR